MTEHRGYTLQKIAGGKFLGRVRVAGGYRSKSFSTESQAETWAKTRATAIALGMTWNEPGTAIAPRASTAELGRQFILTLEHRGRSRDHLDDTARGFNQLAELVPDLASPKAQAGIEDWLAHLTRSDGKAGTLSPAMRNKRLTMVRAMCRWAMNRDLLAKDPTRGIGRSSLPEYLRPQFTVDELRRCLARPFFKAARGHLKKGDPPKRDPWHLLFATLAFTGMRFQEAVYLRWEDVDLGGGMLSVRLDSGAEIKRNRERLVPLQAGLRALLEPLVKKSGRLFDGMEHNATRPFRAFLGRCKVPVDGRSPHSLRHTYAGLMIATGVSAPLLMTYLGHSSAATMLGYTKLSARFVNSVKGWERGEFQLT